MNTMTREYNPLGKFFGLFLMVAALFIAATFIIPTLHSINTVTQAYAVAVPKVLENAHADYIHGEDAQKARNVCKTYGISQAYQQLDNGYYHWLCLSPSLGWVDWIVNKVNGKWEEATAFQPKDGTLTAVTDWIKRKTVKWIDLDTLKSIL